MACELARRDIPVRIIDKLSGIIPFCRATGIHSRTLEIFQDMGVIQPILEAGEPIRGASQYANGVRFKQVRYSDLQSPFPYSISLQQNLTESILHQRLNEFGIRVERETELIRLQDCLTGIEATLQHADGSRETLETPWLIGCDGAHSMVRHLNHQRFPGEPDPRLYVVADVITDAPVDHSEFQFFFSDAGTLFMFPVPAGRTLIIADVPVQPPAACCEPSIEEIATLVEHRGPDCSGVYEPRWLSYFHINYRLARHYRNGRTFLAGDAAHIHSPIGGQGMNTGIQDAYNLGWKLALVYQGKADHSLLESYEKERRGVAEDVLKVTRSITERAEAYTGVKGCERDRLYFHAAVPETERIRNQRHHQGLDLDYRKSPVCSESVSGHRDIAEHGPHAGAEAPDAGNLELNGETRTLFDLIGGVRHVMLIFIPDSPEAATFQRLIGLATQVREAHADNITVYLVTGSPESEIAADSSKQIPLIRDTANQLRQRFGVSGECLYLIRPDGYIGYRGNPVRLRPLRDYLDRLFTVARGLTTTLDP